MIATYHKTVHGVLRTRTICKMNIETYWNKWTHIKTLRPGQHDRRFADDILKYIFRPWKYLILFEIILSWHSIQYLLIKWRFTAEANPSLPWVAMRIKMWCSIEFIVFGKVFRRHSVMWTFIFWSTDTKTKLGFHAYPIYYVYPNS